MQSAEYICTHLIAKLKRLILSVESESTGVKRRQDATSHSGYIIALINITLLIAIYVRHITYTHTHTLNIAR